VVASHTACLGSGPACVTWRLKRRGDHAAGWRRGQAETGLTAAHSDGEPPIIGYR